MNEPGQPSTRVLVVDDVAANARLLDAVLTPRRYQVRTATSGEEALRIVAEGEIDIVLLDVNMPGMTGYEVCRRIREDPATALLPIVMVTAAAAEERYRALEAGADDFLRQPVEQAELLARVRSLARLKHYHDTLEGQAGELAAWNRMLEEQVQDQLVELEHLRELRRFLSPQLAEAVFESADRSLLEPHRREVAVLAWELRGMATVSGDAGPEEELSVIETFHRLLGQLIDEHGATVGSFTGESLLAFFGDPVVQPDAARRAVVLAAALRDAGEELTGRLRRRGYEVTTAAGAGLGYATLGRIGFEGRFDYGAFGPVVTRARRLCELAGDGEVLLGPRLHDTVLDVVDVGPVKEGYPRDADEVLSGTPLVALRTGASAAVEAPSPAPPPGPPSALGTVEPELDIRVLGSLEVRFRGEPIPLTASKERALLALLVANRGQTLPVDRLAEDLWHGSPPDSATAALRVHVSRLRKRLAVSGIDGILVTRPPGYLIDVPPRSIDSACFEAAVDAAHQAADEQRWEVAVEGFRAALALWRGPALAEVASSTFAAAEAIRLEESRLTAFEDCMAAELACRHHREVIPELEGLVHQHPLRERLWELLMLALHRAGRQAEALRAFQQLRSSLGEELGLEPSPALVDLERAIVAHDPSVG